MKTLTIAIPTYNRAALLKETLDVLLPQMTDRVEIVIYNNASPDGTLAYLESLGSAVTVITQTTNVGSDPNQFDCMSAGTGQYIWVLSDDDLPFSDTVSSILTAIDCYAPPVLYLDVRWSDENVSAYTSAPVNTEWEIVSSEEALQRMGIHFTFLSCLVVRRDIVDLDFVRTRFGTNLVPAAYNMSSFGIGKSVAVSTKPVIMGRGGAVGGYNAWVVFSKNVRELFDSCDRAWFSRSALRNAYQRHLLGGSINHVARMWPIDFRGMLVIFRYSWSYPGFYTAVLPILTLRFARKVFRIG